MVGLQIPARIYGFDSAIYVAAAIIGFLVSYYAFRLYNVTNKKSHFYFYLSFTLLSMSFSVLSLVSIFNFLNFETFSPISLFDQIVYVDDFGFWIYYAASLVAYILLALAYLPEKAKFFPIALPLWYKGFPYFQVASIFMLSYVIFRSAVNYKESRSTNSALVLLSFLSLGLYHLLSFMAFFSKFAYVAAHLFLILGFGSLLTMLLRVSKR